VRYNISRPKRGDKNIFRLLINVFVYLSHFTSASLDCKFHQFSLGMELNKTQTE